MRTLQIVILVPLIAKGVFADERLTWDYRGYVQLCDAATEAKRTHRRLLVGVPGVGT